MLQQNNLSKPYSDATAEAIDAEIRAIIDRQYARVKKLLETKREELNTVAQELLLENEMIYRDRVVELIGESPFAKKTEEEEVKPAEDSTQDQEGSEVSMPEAQDDNAETGPSTQKEDSTSTEEKL